MKVEWHHSFGDEPVVLYSEVSDGIEVRKVEVYPDGRMDYADRDTTTGSTILSEVIMPTVEEIADQVEFVLAVISADDFDSIWQRAINFHSGR